MRIEFNGLEEIEGKLRDNCNLDDIRTVVRQNGAELQSKMQRKATFRGHYEWKAGKGLVFVNPSGTTKRSISLELRDGGMTAAVGPSTEYSPYLEYGTRFMTAQPFIGPAFNEQKIIFKNDLQKLFK